ncbi:competence protein ComK [Ferdinandcohnia sp. Marseille-Q9671]
MSEIQTVYEVTPQTMAILPTANLEYSAIVIEEHQTIYVKQTPLQIIKAACLEGGASYEGRRKAVTHLTGAIQKVPLPINPRRNIFAFPTHSPTAFECSWIFQYHVKAIVPAIITNPTSQSSIILKNNQTLSMGESHYTLLKQYQRTAMCMLQYTTQETVQSQPLLGI